MPQWEQPNRPRIQVAWVEALAFCCWLTACYRSAGIIGAEESIRLPTEAEWEQAAAGGDSREYPWGDGYRVGHANVDESYDKTGPYNLGQTTAVGLYPQGVSPVGLLDCAGNVWECAWTNTGNRETRTRPVRTTVPCTAAPGTTFLPTRARPSATGSFRVTGIPRWVFGWCVRAPSTPSTEPLVIGH